MKQNTKKAIAILLIAAMLFTLMPISAMAETIDENSTTPSADLFMKQTMDTTTSVSLQLRYQDGNDILDNLFTAEIKNGAETIALIDTRDATSFTACAGQHTIELMIIPTGYILPAEIKLDIALDGAHQVSGDNVALVKENDTYVLVITLEDCTHANLEYIGMLYYLKHWLVCGCGESKWEEHYDHNNDSKCDVCQIAIDENNECIHPAAVWNDQVPPKALTHEMNCDVCGKYMDAMDDHYDHNNDGKCDVCQIAIDENNECIHPGAEWNGLAADSIEHRIKCSVCEGYWEAHYDNNNDGVCDACSTQMIVAVGGKILADGQYLSNSGVISTQAPANEGYAHYKDGVLTLNNYQYCGEGYTYIYDDNYTSALFFAEDIALVLLGENTLINTDQNGDGISGFCNLVLSGSGSLTVEAAYCIYLYYGSLTITDVELQIDAKEDGICCDNGDITLSGDGTIRGESYGVYTDKKLTIGPESNFVFHGKTAAIAAESVHLTNVIIKEPAGYTKGTIVGYDEENSSTYGINEWDEALGDYVFVPATTIKIAPDVPVYPDIPAYSDVPVYIEVIERPAASKPEVTVSNTAGNETVKAEAENIADDVFHKAADMAAEDSSVSIIGGKDSAVQIIAKENNKPLESFTAPVSVTVPVRESDIKTVKDTGKLTLALVQEDEEGNITLTYVGGKYNADNNTFCAYTNAPGNYVLVEKEDLVKVELTIDNSVAQINDKPVKKDVPSRIVNDHTLVPAAFVLRHMGCSVDWISDTRTVIVTLPNGASLYMPVDIPIPGYDAAPIIENGRTLVPVEYIADTMNAHVLFVEETQQIILVK